MRPTAFSVGFSERKKALWLTSNPCRRLISRAASRKPPPEARILSTRLRKVLAWIKRFAQHGTETVTRLKARSAFCNEYNSKICRYSAFPERRLSSGHIQRLRRSSGLNFFQLTAMPRLERVHHARRHWPFDESPWRKLQPQGRRFAMRRSRLPLA